MEQPKNVRYLGASKSCHDVAEHLREIADELERGNYKAVAVTAVGEDVTQDYLILTGATITQILALVGNLGLIRLQLENSILNDWEAESLEHHDD